MSCSVVHEKFHNLGVCLVVCFKVNGSQVRQTVFIHKAKTDQSELYPKLT